MHKQIDRQTNTKKTYLQFTHTQLIIILHLYYEYCHSAISCVVSRCEQLANIISEVYIIMQVAIDCSPPESHGERMCHNIRSW